MAMKRIDLWKDTDWRMDPFTRVQLKIFDDQLNFHTFLYPSQLDEMAEKEGKINTDSYKKFKEKVDSIKPEFRRINNKGFVKELEDIRSPRIQIGRTNYKNGNFSDYYIYILVNNSNYDRKTDSWVLDSWILDEAKNKNVVDVLLFDEYTSCCFYTSIGKLKSGTKENGKIYIQRKHFEINQMGTDKFPNYLSRKG